VPPPCLMATAQRPMTFIGSRGTQVIIVLLDFNAANVDPERAYITAHLALYTALGLVKPFQMSVNFGHRQYPQADTNLGNFVAFR
jgi:hypothetical protein